MENIRVLKVNSVKCLMCNTVLVSKYRHDYVSCNCDNGTFVDGGNSYVRLGGMDLDLIEDLSEYEEVSREVMEERKRLWRKKQEKDFNNALFELLVERNK